MNVSAHGKMKVFMLGVTISELAAYHHISPPPCHSPLLRASRARLNLCHSCLYLLHSVGNKAYYISTIDIKSILSPETIFLRKSFTQLNLDQDLGLIHERIQARFVRPFEHLILYMAFLVKFFRVVHTGVILISEITKVVSGV